MSNRFTLKRRTLLGGTAALAVGAPAIARAQDNKRIVVGTWGGDYSRLLAKNIETPLLAPKGWDVVKDEAGDRKFPGEQVLQPSTGGRLLRAGFPRVRFGKRSKLTRNGNLGKRASLRASGRFPGERPFDTCRLQPPFRHQAITRQPLLQAAVDLAVMVRQIAAGNDTQPLDVEERVFRSHGVKGPLNAINSDAQCFLALPELQPPAQTLVFISGQDSQ